MQKIEKYLIMVMAVIAGLCLYIVTPYGLATSPDSIGYLKGAEGLIDGQGLKYFNPQWPPVYPILIALFSWVFGVSVVDGARLLSALIFGAIIYLISNYDGQEKKLIWFIFVILLCINPLMTHIYFYAWSETLLFIIILINFKYLEKIINVKNNEVKKYLLINTILISCAILAAMTRYVGVTILITNVIVILIFSQNVLIFKRIKLITIHVIIFGAASSSWFIYTYLNFKTLSNRSIKLHPPTIDQIEKALAEIGKWYLPEYLRMGDFIYISIGIALILYIFRNIYIKSIYDIKIKKNQEYIILIYSVFSLIYLCFILVSVTLIDVATPLDNRILSPVYISLAICLIKELSEKINKFNIKYFLIIYLLLMSISSLIDLKHWSMLSRYNGIELSSKEYKNKEINRLIKECDKKIKIISDKPWEFDMYTKAKIDWLPRKYDMTSGVINKNYNQQIRDLYAVYSMVIISDLQSEYINEINEMNKYEEIYSDIDGILLVNRIILKENLCNFGLKKTYELNK